MENVKLSQEAKLHYLKSVSVCEVSFEIHLIKMMHAFLHTLFPLYSVICMAVSERILCEAAPCQFQQFLDLACGKKKNFKKSEIH